MDKKILLLLVFTVVLVGTNAQAIPTAQTEEQTPLLMRGKKSLYQRVLTRPEAALYATPKATGTKQSLPPFSVYYVYARKTLSGVDWVQVGIDKYRGAQGWIPEKHLIEWKQTLIVSFKDPAGHDRVLLFRDRESLKSLVESQDLFGYDLLYRKAAANQISPESPVISIQPRAYVDILEDFYLVPILRHEDLFVGGEQARLLEVSTLPLEANEKSPAKARKSVKKQDREYRSGIVFVIDTTISMGPYIDRTRDVVRKIYSTIETQGLLNKVSFGLIAYRDNPDLVSGLEYLTRTYVNLKEGTKAHAFLSKVTSVQPARVSSKDFVEDAYAGIKHAIDNIDWTGFDARYVVLISDAGARPGHDSQGKTGMNAEAIRQLAFDKGLSVWVLHLKTAEGKRNHASAEQQYRRLSNYPEVGELYYPVKLGSVSDFGRVLESFTGKITKQVAASANSTPPKLAPYRETTGDDLKSFEQKISKLGYALRMRYLLRQEGGRVPSVFNAWMVDRDITKPDRSALEVRVLLTRDQLSDLQFVLKQVLETAEEGVLSPRDFLEELKSVAATISRDPASASGSTRTTGAKEKNLADLGYMREYIEDLPYKGEVMNLSLETWEDWPAKQQLNFLHRLESKINYYQVIHDNTDLWISLDGGAVDGDSVFPIALEMLP